jgi:hypothetical protein
MLPIDTLYLFPRDEARGSAADALALVASQSEPFEAAAILAMAAALDHYHSAKAADAAASLPIADTAYQAVCEAVARAAVAYAKAADEAERAGNPLPALDPLRDAERLARCCHAAAWLADLLYHSISAIEASSEPEAA